MKVWAIWWRAPYDELHGTVYKTKEEAETVLEEILLERNLDKANYGHYPIFREDVTTFSLELED